MTRVSLTEAYDNKDVVSQICRLKDAIQDMTGGIIDDVSIVNDQLIFVFSDGTRTELPLPSPTGIDYIDANLSGINLTITLHMTNSSTHSFTVPLTGLATESYVDTLDAQNVKLTGAQTIAGQKTLSDSPIVPTSPTTPTGAVNSVYVNDATDGVNNIVHKSGNETIGGIKQISANDIVPIIIKGTTPRVQLHNTQININDSIFSEYLLPRFEFCDINGSIYGRYGMIYTANALSWQWENRLPNRTDVMQLVSSESTSYLIAPYRTSGYGNNDVVTIGTLRALGLIQ